MTKSQNTKNEQQKDLCITSEQLTEQWKKGELPEGFYYVKCDWSDEVEIRYVHNGVDDWKAIFAEVPSYDEWFKIKNLVSLSECLQEKNIECLHRENKLKELLKEWVQFETEENPNDFTVMSERMSGLANKTKEALK